MSTALAVEIPDVAEATGIYPDVSFAEYAAWDACSSSRLGYLARTPAHLRAYLDDDVERETTTLTIGRAAHCAVLEPDDFPARYVRNVEGDGRTKAVKEARAALATEHPDAEVLSPADYDRCVAIRDALYTSPINAAARGLLAFCGERELSILWDQDGVRCKGRIDTEMERAGALVDVKTARDAGPDAFSRSIWTYRYHVQAALYLAGMDALRPGVYDAFAFVAVEKEPPYAAAVHQLAPEALEAGMREAERLIRLYARCMEQDDWPGYGPSINRIGLPPWARTPADDLIELVGLPAGKPQLTNGVNHEHAASDD